jgi:hypothetical protein
MRREIITPLHLGKLPVIEVEYALRSLHTIAVQVNNETIGAMAIEFGVEIMSSHPNNKWLPTAFERKNAKGEKTSIERTIVPGEWLVVLDDEVHIFPHDVFWNTFGQAKGPAHEEQFIGIVTKAELENDVETEPPNGKVYQNTGFINLPVELTAEGKGTLPNEQSFPLVN